ncbi:Hydrazine synthase subunit beta [Phycisphaerales bacterium]|nr:Hydrazine synthase subunit beta [Phycisphaerales bacterium]
MNLIRVLIVAAASAACAAQVVGPRDDGGVIVSTSQLIRPAGRSLEFPGRPVDLALSPDGKHLYAKDNRGLITVDTGEWRILQELKVEGASMVGLCVTPDGTRVLSTTADDELAELSREPGGTLSLVRKHKLHGPGGKGKSFPCGVVVTPDGQRALVCLSVNNTLAEVELASGRVLREIAVGVAPFAVLVSPDSARAYVSNWGGRPAAPGEKTATSAGTPAVIDKRGIATSGGVSVVDLAEGKQVAFIETGRSASGLAITRDGSRVFVANANDDTVSIIDARAGTVAATIHVRPDYALAFGSMPNGLALSPDDQTLYVSLAGNNAVCVVGLDKDAGGSVRGFVPTGWYPGNLVVRENHVYVANIKGVGSRSPRGNRLGYNSHGHRGTLQIFDVPDSAALATMSAQVREDAMVPQSLKAMDRAEKGKGVKPVPVPARAGEPSLIEHCVYIIKENRTYDQVFGAIGRGNGHPKLCIYGREITPNIHALADQFVLLDNYYCNGVLSADGHSWATEGNVTPYLERSFGGFTRSYTHGDDPLTYSSSGFIWDHVLAAGLTFRNYGEFDEVTVSAPYQAVYQDWLDKAGKVKITRKNGVENLARYTNPEYPGWNLDIPDVCRADLFLKELAEFEKKGSFPNLVVIYLPNDHTSGTDENKPTPRSMVADNDLALGRIVEGLSQSRFWNKMAIFVNEDDPQDGFDHVDGHRSVCLVISPYSRRAGAVVSEFYNQSSVIHTIERILGITPMNQMYALAPVMKTCFVETPDFTPFAAVPNTVPLCEMNPKKAGLAPLERELAEISEHLALDKPDRCDEDTLNRILWHAARGIDAPYPADLAGAHGKGLKALGLRFDEAGIDDEDDDD